MIGSPAVGSWDVAGFEFSIVEDGRRLLVRYPEAPAAYESPLTELDGGGLLVETGPLAGARIEFTRSADGSVRGLAGGVLAVSPLDRSAAPPPGSGLTAPDLELEAVEERAFGELWDEVVAGADGRLIEPGSVTRFVQWLMAKEAVIFHGSTNAGIEEFRPIRTSMELNDETGRGNLGAVYGTHDGLWAMFFAIVDRDAISGSIRNGVARFQRLADGAPLDLYHFSVNQETLERGPLTSGCLYLMPMDRFRRLPFYPGGPPSNEWACGRPVRPLARLTVQPEDFPFHDRIGVHDDGPLLEFERVGALVHEGIVDAGPIEGGFEIVTTADPETIADYVRMGAEFQPDVERVASPVEGGTRIVLTGPVAFVHAMGRRLEPFLPEGD